MQQDIIIKGARTHNLKNLDLTIPKNKLVVITGLSGSGKSSLAFDTLYAEGQRRYVESLSAYARQFLSLMEKPEVDSISGLSPAIAIEQKSATHNPRSTVGTVTEIYDYLRLLFARVGVPYCPEHNLELNAQTIVQITDYICQLPANSKLMICSPVIIDGKGDHAELFDDLQKKGFIRVLVNGDSYELSDIPEINPNKKHSIDVVIDRFINKPGIELRISDSVTTAVELSQGLVKVLPLNKSDKLAEKLFSIHHACLKCGFSVEKLEPKHFSFNSPKGACNACDGLGLRRMFDPELVIHEETLSIAEGAVRGFDSSNVSFYDLMKSLSEHYNFSLHTPWKQLSPEIKSIILHGSGREKIALKYTHHRYGTRISNKVYEGVIVGMNKRYQETSSEAVRQQLAKYLSYIECEVCNGSRLNIVARHVKVSDYSIQNIIKEPIGNLCELIKKIKLKDHYKSIATPILKEISVRLEFLESVGLSYLFLARAAETLSGGESQRIRLASQLGSGLTGVMYVLDEPSIGLHPRDNQRLINTLIKLRDLGNTVIVIEHDEETMLQADYLLDIGPGAGVHGGRLVALGTPKEVAANKKSLTGAYLRREKNIDVPTELIKPDPRRMVRIVGASANNLKNITVNIPVGCFTCVTGVSGSGKSSLINSTLLPHALLHLHRQYSKKPGKVEQITGLDNFDRVVSIDQSPIGRTPRSNPATYVGLFTAIRECFAATQDSRARGYQVGRFSFNVKGGRCEVCEGGGQIKVEMHFLADMYVNCEHCRGTRYNRDTLTIKYNSKNIDDILQMTIAEAVDFFAAIPVIAQKCKTLVDVGLGYLKLGQSATTLSGGEAQRIKLAKELSKRSTGNTLYILDEPTTGLHIDDIRQLLVVLARLKSMGNTLVIIEHNLDVIKCADWLIDMGPEGGDRGGEVIAQNTPTNLCKVKQSFTGSALKKHLAC
jgi:excinuclease ABC subunit A